MADQLTSLEDLKRRILQSEDVKSDDLIELVKLENERQASRSTWQSVLPWAAIVTSLGTAVVVLLEQRYESSRAESEQSYNLALAERQYMQEFAAGIFDVEGVDPDERRIEQRRRICITAKLGAFQYPDYIIGLPASDDGYAAAQTARLNEDFQCNELEGDDLLPESLPNPPIITYENHDPSNADIPLDDLLDDLRASESSIRRGARTALANRGPNIVRPAMDRVLALPGTYRLDLGVTVALTEMMRENINRRPEIINRLTETDLAYLARLATNSDRTIRIYAAEFLFDLGDTRLLDIALQLWSERENSNSRFNLALIIKGASPHVSLSDRERWIAETEALLGQVGPQTDELLEEALGFLQQG